MSCRFCAKGSEIDDFKIKCMIKQEIVECDFYCGEFSMRMGYGGITLAEVTYKSRGMWCDSYRAEKEVRRKKSKLLKKRNKEIKELKERLKNDPHS